MTKVETTPGPSERPIYMESGLFMVGVARIRIGGLFYTPERMNRERNLLQPVKISGSYERDLETGDNDELLVRLLARSVPVVVIGHFGDDELEAELFRKPFTVEGMDNPLEAYSVRISPRQGSVIEEARIMRGAHTSHVRNMPDSLGFDVEELAVEVRYEWSPVTLDPVKPHAGFKEHVVIDPKYYEIF